MINKILLMMAFALILITGSVNAISLCQEQTDIDDIPCLGLTRVLSCSGNITVTNLNTSQTYNLTTSHIGGGIYNFSFFFNKSSYSLVDCQNSTATMVVGDFEGDKLWKFAIVLGIIGAAFIYAIMGKILFDGNKFLVKTSLYITSILLLLVGIQISLLTSSNTNINGVMNTTVTLTLALIGFLFLYLFIYYFISVIKSIKDYKRQQSEI